MSIREEFDKLTKQAKVALVGYGVMLLAMIVTAVMTKPAASSIAPILYFAATGIAGVYGVNCAVIGECNIYAWVQAYVAIIVGMFAVFALFKSIKTGTP